jgi:hypothetical protein
MKKGEEFYYSESKGVEILVDDMAPAYIDRAFRKFLRNNDTGPIAQDLSDIEKSLKYALDVTKSLTHRTA